MSTSIIHFDNGGEFNAEPTVLSRGRIATVYEDPFSRRKAIGVAELTRCIRRDFETGLEHWEVRFIHTGETAVHRIRPSLGAV